MNAERSGCLALACLMLSTVHAEDSGRHSVTLSAQGDENDNRQWLGKLALPLGDHAWVQGTLGTTERPAGRPSSTNIVGAAMGIVGETVSGAVEFVQRSGDGQFEQQDWAAALDWRGSRGGLGADVFLRSASDESTTTQSGGPFAAPVTTRVTESVDCRGLGLHGDFALTPQATVFAGAMRYRCDFDFGSTPTGSSSPLSSLLGSNAALSGIGREQAVVDSSYRVGGRYQLRSAAVSAQYFRDRIANTDETMNTVQAQVEFPLAEHWRITPTLGYSSGGSFGHTAYGGLSLSFNW